MTDSHILKEIAYTLYQIFLSVSQNLQKRENQYSLTFFLCYRVICLRLLKLIIANNTGQYITSAY